MGFSKKQIIFIDIFLVISIVAALIGGISLGLSLAGMQNLVTQESIRANRPALPTRVLDRHGELITEFFSDERRLMISLDEMPMHLVYAVITREDDTFFEHYGFSLRGILRAVWNRVKFQLFQRGYSSGGSSITQQIAGLIYDDRTDISIARKIRELWWAFYLEKTQSKHQILEAYLNHVYLGHGVYGVEAASQHYFGRSVKDITVAESAMLVIQLSSPGLNSPISNPNRARVLQKDALDRMAEQGYISHEEALLSFDEYWLRWDPTRAADQGAYLSHRSKAPYFTDYIREQLGEMLYGPVDIFRDGYTVHTTLDMQHQRLADEVMANAFLNINERYITNAQRRLGIVDSRYIPIVDLLALNFNLEQIRVAEEKRKTRSKQIFEDSLIHPLLMVSYLFNEQNLRYVSLSSFRQKQQAARQTVIEGALISIDNRTGHILSMVGGSDYETKKFNRATQARLQPGSAFKPLYYSAAISSGDYTAATRLYDGPISIRLEDGGVYAPENFLGLYEGHVLLRHALATSMNIPSIQVLSGVGFEAAIERASRLLGMYDRRYDERIFPRVYPLGLGIVQVAPINMARAFASFPTGGQEVEPIAILKVEDREGNIVLEPEIERMRSFTQSADNRIMSSQEAYIMTNMLESTVSYGTLRRPSLSVGGFDGMSMAGKTGTTQNWGDAWTVGFSPYVTSAVWFGFDMPGNSLGREITGSTAAGPVWAEYMKKVHADLPRREFQKPETGIVEVLVSSETGLLPSSYTSNTRTEYFIAGTEPTQQSTYEQMVDQQRSNFSDKIRNDIVLNVGDDPLLFGDFQRSLDSQFKSLMNSMFSNQPLSDLEDDDDDEEDFWN